MHLENYQIYKINIPSGRKIGDNMCCYENFHTVVIRLEMNDGTFGWGFGEKAYGGYFLKKASWDQKVPTQKELIADFKENYWDEIKGLSVSELQILLCTKFYGDTPLKAAIRFAVWDLIGKAAGKPLYKLLGGNGYETRKFAYASACEYHLSDDEVKTFYTDKVAQGFTAFKLKVGQQDPRIDLRRLKIMREVIGEDSQLSVDANIGWTPETAVKNINLFQSEGINLFAVEDPLPPSDLVGYKYLSENVNVPLIGHDYLPEAFEITPLLKNNSLQYLRARDSLNHAFSLLPIAQKYKKKIIGCNTLFEWNIHFCLAFPEVVDRIEFADLKWNELPETPIKIENGHMIAPDAPGHGFAPKEELLNEWIVNE